MHPFLAASLVPGVSTSNHAAAVYLPPEAMHQHKLEAEEPVLVGLAAPYAYPVPPPSPHTPTHGRQSGASSSNRSPSIAAPQNPDPSSIHPANLWDRAAFNYSCQLPCATGAAALSRFWVPAVTWPCGKLVRGTAAASAAVLEALGQQYPGTQLLLCRFPRPQNSPAGQGLGLSPCGLLKLQICSNAKSSALAVAPPTPPTAAGDVATLSASPARTPTSITRSSSSGRKSSSSSSKPVAKAATPSSGKKAGEPLHLAGELAGAATANWQARLLASGVDWSKSEQRLLLERIALTSLQGRLLLAGGIVLVPVLGQRLICTVASAAASPVADPGAEPSAAGQQTVWQVTADTRVMLLSPGDPAGDLGEAAGGSTGGRTAPGGSNSSHDMASLVARARKAAELEVEGSGQEAAMDAAERAVRAGQAASSTRYSELGGVSRYSQALQQLVVLPLTAPHLFMTYGIRVPRGVLLQGPPGSGKTMLARAAAAEAGAHLMVINGPDIVSQFYGESEAGIRGVFAAARALGPSVVFIDEIDAIVPAREQGGGSGGKGGASGHLAAAGGGSAAAGEASSRLLTQLLVCMDGISPGSKGPDDNPVSSSNSSSSSGSALAGDRVIVVAATNRPSSIDSALRRPGRFEREMEIGVPSPEERQDILAHRLAGMSHSVSQEQLRQIAAGAHGFVAADLMALCNEAAFCALRRFVLAQQHQQQQERPQHQHQPVLLQQKEQEQGPQVQLEEQQGQQHQEQPWSTVHEDQQQHQQQQSRGQGDGLIGSLGPWSVGAGNAASNPVGLCVWYEDFMSARQQVSPSALRDVTVEVPQVNWDDVGGLSAVKQRLKEAVEWPQKHPEALARLGATAPRGILLYGPPGCSKTLLARAVAASAGLNFLSIKGGELFSKFVGESERAVAALFARARAAAPCGVFFDEIDGLVGNRGDTGSQGVGERVLAQLLMEMDGLQPRLGVVVLGATNRPDRVDAALLRPGRFDRLLFVPPPDEGARQEIFRVHLKRTPLAGDVDLGELARRTEGYTGADISALVREAALAALVEDLGAAEVAMRHFEAGLATVAPSVGPGMELMEIYHSFQRQGRLEQL